jgi:Uma2 family endonuclease
MNSIPQLIPHYSVADYQQWPGDWELWNGVPISMGPSPFGPHGAMVAELAYQFKAAFRRNKIDSLEVVVEIDWIIDNSTVVRPDLAIVARPLHQAHLHSPPFLVVEVASESTAEKDRTAKFELYQQQGVKYYLIGEPVDQRLEVFQLVDARYQLQTTRSPFPFELADARLVVVDFTS